MTNPYLIEGPALWSFSGGRTSAFMLHKALESYGGRLPDDHVVTFANTGLEREETLRFVHEVSVRWNVKIHWLEWRDDEIGFEEVGYNSASRDGQPFRALVAKRQFTPNGVSRFCTQELKIRVMRDFCRSMGWEHWTNIVGLRADEWPRLLKMQKRNNANKERFKSLAPMASKYAPATKRDVLSFWLGENSDPLDLRFALPQGFDLGLRDYEGNCTLCMMKGKKKKLMILRERPDLAKPWIEMETSTGGNFSARYSISDLVTLAKSTPMLPGIFDFDEEEMDEEFDAECDLICGYEEVEDA